MPTIFITGASSGIGKAAARLFAEQGWQVGAAMRMPENVALCARVLPREAPKRRGGAG